MAKTLIPERQLIDAINDALRKEWPYTDSHCKVSELRQVALPDRNWEVAMTNTGGDSLRKEECDALTERVLSALIMKYDVQW